MRTSYWPLVNAKGKVNLECFSYLSVIICNVGNIIRAPISSFALDCLTEFHPVLGNYREQRKKIITLTSPNKNFSCFIMPGEIFYSWLHSEPAWVRLWSQSVLWLKWQSNLSNNANQSNANGQSMFIVFLGSGESWDKLNLFIHVNTLMLEKASFQWPLNNNFHQL